LMDLEPRIVRLEDGPCPESCSQVAEISGRMHHLPTAWMMIVPIVGGQISLVGLIAAIALRSLRNERALS
jgi:hypothetical protein